MSLQAFIVVLRYRSMAPRIFRRLALGILLVVIPLFCVLGKAATPVELWTQRYDGPLSSANDEAYRVVRDNNGDIIIFGITSDFNFSTDLLTIKYSGTDGSLLWSRRYDGLDKLDERIGALALDSAGNVLVTGSSARAAGGWDLYTAKYAAADGAVLWEKSYSGTGNREDHPVSLRVDSTGNVVLAAMLFQTNRYDTYLANTPERMERCCGIANTTAASVALTWNRASWSSIQPRTSCSPAHQI